MPVPPVTRKDLLGGALMLVLGLGTMVEASHYRLGTLSNMGPGYFPLALGIILAATGALIMLSGLRAVPAFAAAEQRPEWRGWLCIVAGVAVFAVIGRYGGLLPATFMSVFIAALGDRKNTLPGSALLAASMTLIALIVFWWLLKIQLPLFRWG